MRLSKQHKLYAAVLGLALAALGADRVLFSSPATDAAEATAPAAHVRPAPQRRAPVATAAQSVAVDSVIDSQAIAARLDEMAQTAGYDLDGVCDAFTPSPVWVKPAEAPTVAVAPAAPKVEDGRVKQFLRDHRLTAVMNAGRHGIAVIDGQPLRPGQAIGGFKLVTVSVKERKATFERGADRIELRLPDNATVAQMN